MKNHADIFKTYFPHCMEGLGSIKGDEKEKQEATVKMWVTTHTNVIMTVENAKHKHTQV